MPLLGADMEAGTLVEWVKHPGDTVKRGDVIAVVDTQKGAIEIEVFEDGVLEKTVIEPGQKVPVGTVLAIISSASPEVRAPAAPPPLSPEPPRPVAPPASPPPVTPPAVESSKRARVSPIARALAADLGVNLACVVGTGPQGAITRQDVERVAAALKAAAATPGTPLADRQSAMRAAIAAAMARSKREIPHYYLSTTVDLTAALAWLRTENESRKVTERLLPAALLIKSVAFALREVPELNGHWIDGGFSKGSGIHVGVAISLRGGGLVAPAIHDTDTLDLTRLMRQLQDLVARARAGSLKSSELADPTITVTNLGDQGVESTFGIIYPPQVALVGFGKVVERPWAVAGKVEIRPLVTATLSGDHRATDGHRGGLLLSAIDRWLQTPETL
jgi:pyruvate dehydrogenase E2 component (dihydrolipoyllysine-residue acetyltransferase)